MTKETMIIETVSGQLIDLANIDPAKVLLTDIVHGLSLVNRFNGRHVQVDEPLNLNDAGTVGCIGQTAGRDEPVTVLQHSYAMYLFAKHKYRDNPRIAIECLLHDAPEAYTGDIITPLKNRIPMITDIEQNVFNALETVYRLPLSDSEAVKDIDALALRIEWETFVAQTGSADEYNERAKYYGERTADADPMDDVAMHRALYEARSHSRRALVDKVLLILYSEIVRDARERYLAGRCADEERQSTNQRISCTVFVDKQITKEFTQGSCAEVVSEINNLYTCKPIEDGAVTITGTKFDMVALREELSNERVYETKLIPDPTTFDVSALVVQHKTAGKLLRLGDNELTPNWGDVNTGTIDRLIQLEPSDILICTATHHHFHSPEQAEHFARKVLLELLDKDATARYSARVQVLNKRTIVIFYKEAVEDL